MLLQYLHKTQTTVILGIINERINFQGLLPFHTCFTSLSIVYASSKSFYLLTLSHTLYGFTVFPGQPSSISDDAELVTLTGSTQDTANQINKKEVHWGVRWQKYQLT